MQQEEKIEACYFGATVFFGLTAFGFYVTASYYQHITFTQEKPEEKKMMTYLGSEVMGSDKYVYFDTDGNLETTEEVRKVDVADLPAVRDLKVGQQVSVKDWRKILPEQQKTRE